MGKIYLIKCYEDDEVLYKIGFTKNTPNQRLKTFETGNPNDLEVVEEFVTNYDTKLEVALHNRFRSKRVKREWFRLNENDISTFRESCEKMESNFELLEKDNYFFRKLLSNKEIKIKK